MSIDNHTEGEQQPKGHKFTTHNFDAMNRAIDSEVDRRFEISELYRYEGGSRRSLMFMHIATSLSVIAVASAVVWWLFNPPSGSTIAVNTETPSFSNTFDRSTTDALNALSEQEKTSGEDKIFINTSFTVFHRTLIPTGEYAVTGKTYQPENLKHPNEQYCYLEKTQSASGLSGEPLASINKGDFTLETNDATLINFARKYCQFTN